MRVVLDAHDLTFDDPDAAEERLLDLMCSSTEPLVQANALVVLASLYESQARHSEAIEAAESALRIAPASPLQAYVLAELSWRIFGDEAIDDLLGIVRAHDPSRSYLTHLAECLEGEVAFARGDYALAAQKLLRSLDYEGRNPVERRGSVRLARMLVEAGRERDACRTFLHASLERCTSDALADPLRTLLERLDS
jgi:tetratricopeptide (TPR) repeat protein